MVFSKKEIILIYQISIMDGNLDEGVIYVYLIDLPTIVNFFCQKELLNCNILSLFLALINLGFDFILDVNNFALKCFKFY